MGLYNHTGTYNSADCSDEIFILKEQLGDIEQVIEKLRVDLEAAEIRKEAKEREILLRERSLMGLHVSPSTPLKRQSLDIPMKGEHLLKAGTPRIIEDNGLGHGNEDHWTISDWAAPNTTAKDDVPSNVNGGKRVGANSSFGACLIARAKNSKLASNISALDACKLDTTTGNSKSPLIARAKNSKVETANMIDRSTSHRNFGGNVLFVSSPPVRKDFGKKKHPNTDDEVAPEATNTCHKAAPDPSITIASKAGVKTAKNGFGKSVFGAYLNAHTQNGKDMRNDSVSGARDNNSDRLPSPCDRSDEIIDGETDDDPTPSNRAVGDGSSIQYFRDLLAVKSAADVVVKFPNAKLCREKLHLLAGENILECADLRDLYLRLGHTEVGRLLQTRDKVAHSLKGSLKTDLFQKRISTLLLFS